MSRQAKEYRKNVVQACLKDCIHLGGNDPFGMCLRRFEDKKYYPPTETREKILTDLHDSAVRLLPILTDPIQQERCQDIIRRIEADDRVETRKQGRKLKVEQVDMFATDGEESGW